MTCKDTSALSVPAFGYATSAGRLCGFDGSAMCHRCTGETSTRATSRREPSGDHQYPFWRPISSAATNSASPYVTLSSSGAASTRGAAPSTEATCNAPRSTYAMDVPVGSRCGSMATPPVGISVSTCVSRSTTYRRPARSKSARRRARSAEKRTMPPEDSRARSRRARSSAGISPAPLSPTVVASTTSRSVPLATSSTQRQVAWSAPLRVRRNATRLPSAEIAKFRGTPSEK